MINTLYYGDNLDVLRRYVQDESVDLVYLDPPFKSNQNYNVLFQEHNGSQSAAQIQAFEDTWQWDKAASAAYAEVVEAGGQVSLAMQAFRTVLGESDMLAYLSMMAPRLVELRRVLKATGSIYLHCDPTASHYLKMLMDSIFIGANFVNEIIWQKIRASKAQTKGFGSVHDVILSYAKGVDMFFKPLRVPHSESYIQSHYRNVEEKTGRNYMLDNFTQAGQGEPRRFGNKILVPPTGKHWIWTQERIDEGMEKGLIVFSKSGMPRMKRYLDEVGGNFVEDIWIDIPPINSQAQERLGYPTQKPEALLERIINASSNEGDLVLDPFCGCGTAIAAAQRLNRRWIGIDITYLAISLIKHRLHHAFGHTIKETYEVIGEPTAITDAQELATTDPYQFQWWALGLVNARPVDQKKGADRGIDGRIFFHDESESAKTKQIIISVKAGHTGPNHVRDLRGVVEREKAAIGLLITMEAPTAPMRKESASAGFYDSPWGTKHPKIQILTVGELLEGKTIDAPPSRDFRTFKKAPRARPKDQQNKMFDK